MKSRGRPKGRTIGGALAACAGVGGPLEEVARHILRAAVVGRTENEAAAMFDVCPRQLRRILSGYGMKWSFVRDEYLERTAEQPKPMHPPYTWCSCVDCKRASERAREER